MSKTLVEQVLAAFRVSTPRVAINTSDQEATMQQIVASLPKGTLAVQWDFVRGLTPRNQEAVDKVAQMKGDDDESVGQPVIAFAKAEELPQKSVFFGGSNKKSKNIFGRRLGL